jgi:hypothetical protein
MLVDDITGELPVGAGRKRGSTFVADAEEAEVAAFFGNTHCVGEAEVRVADHAEHGCHAPIDHRLDKHIGHGAHAWRVGRNLDVDAVVADLDGERCDLISVAAGRLAGAGVVVVAVPGAPQPALLDRAFAKGAALVRAFVVDRSVSAVVVRHSEGPAANGDRGDSAFWEFVGIEDPVPVIGCGYVVAHRRRVRQMSTASDRVEVEE